jgi:hypothetical protein
MGLGIDRNGNVVIGATIPYPNAMFTVNNGTSVGAYTASGWKHSSDKRLKTDISKVDNALDKVTAMEGVYFNWKNNPETGRQIGLIAQDVMKVLPEVVSKDNDDYYSISYDEVIPVLINAVKDLKAENEVLKTRVKALEDR